MLSSTFTDLKEHRQRAIDAIQSVGYMPSVMEFSGAHTDGDFIQASLKMVQDAAAFIVVIGYKYGAIPRDSERNPNGLSITELEYNEAVRLGRPIALFVMGQNHRLMLSDIESDPERRQKLDAFR